MLECKRIIEPGEPAYSGYSQKVDVWSLGACFFWMLTGTPLFDRHKYSSDEKLVRAIYSGAFKVPADIEMSS